jgi:formate-dependent nitrite reductase membrane component NrfD
MPYSVQVFTLRRSILLFLSYIISVVYFISHLGDPGLAPLNAELNSICHLLVLLGNLTFMGP